MMRKTILTILKPMRKNKSSWQRADAIVKIATATRNNSGKRNHRYKCKLVSI
jgi:hypothetical protein